jgi:hypothetical protein
MRRSILACAVAMLIVPTDGEAQGAAIALKAGTFGPSAGFTMGLNSRINVRSDVAYFTYEHSGTYRDQDFDLEYVVPVRLFTVGGIIDLHPFGGGFRISGGAMYNANELTISGRSAGPYTVGGRTYTAEEVGELSGTVGPGTQIAPYVGIGFGNPVGRGKRLGLTMDIGVMMQGPPSVQMTGSGMIAPTADEASKIEANLDWVRYYPGFSIGLTYKLF